MKNEKLNSYLNFNVQLFLKWKNHLVLRFMPQLKYKNENQTLFLISYFNLSKNPKWHFRHTYDNASLIIHLILQGDFSSQNTPTQVDFLKLKFENQLYHWETKLKIQLSSLTITESPSMIFIAVTTWV